MWSTQQIDVLWWLYTEIPGLVEVSSSDILDPFGSNQFMLCSQPMCHCFKGCALSPSLFIPPLEILLPFSYRNQRENTPCFNWKVKMVKSHPGPKRNNFRETQGCQYIQHPAYLAGLVHLIPRCQKHGSWAHSSGWGRDLMEREADLDHQTIVSVLSYSLKWVTRPVWIQEMEKKTLPLVGRRCEIILQRAYRCRVSHEILSPFL